nr:hypothetical protein CFP56_74744 [Quercus suber]
MSLSTHDLCTITSQGLNLRLTLVHTLLPSSPAVSIDEFPSPPQTWKGKQKKGESVWTDPTMALGRAHNLISKEELKALSLVPSYELVSRHIHKLMQAESLTLRKDLIEAMGEANDAKAKLKEVSDELRIEKMLVIQKDEKIQSAMLKLNSECEKAIDKEIMANEVTEWARDNEQAGVEGGDEGEGPEDAPVNPLVDTPV